MENLDDGEFRALPEPVNDDAAREAKIKDISNYCMTDDLESRAAHYESDDPAFISHVRRAHKYHTKSPECRGKEWKIEVKGYDDVADKYSRLFFCRRESLPTPEEIREYGALGRCRFVLTYFDPFKANKKAPNGKRGGFVSILSGEFEIVPPVAVGKVVNPNNPAVPLINIPPAPMVDAFQSMLAQIQQMSTQAQAMVMQAANSQMEIMANRAAIVNEGVEKGRLAQQVEERDRRIQEMMAENTRLQKERQQANAQIMALASQDDEPTPDNGIPGWLQPMLEQYGPAILKKFGIELPGSVPGNTGDGPVIPPQS